MTPDELDPLLAEQVAYYRARAAEYDETSPVPGDDASRGELEEALESFAPRGRVLEFACGTGQWTTLLARHASELTALDASPEMLAVASSRVPHDRVRFIEADLFTWQPDGRYDLVFFSAWLSHVPPQRFNSFWTLAAECLAPDGRVFFVDELPAVQAHEQVIPGAVAPAVERSLRSGARYRTVKVFHEPEELAQRLTGLGWSIRFQRVGWRFFYATGDRLKEG
jgi:demethylmenaquinone methyltransferase/2-methoxy-6-polyprenyl-1,4-benzoquinol methylase